MEEVVLVLSDMTTEKAPGPSNGSLGLIAANF